MLRRKAEISASIAADSRFVPPSNNPFPCRKTSRDRQSRKNRLRRAARPPRRTHLPSTLTATGHGTRSAGGATSPRKKPRRPLRRTRRTARSPRPSGADAPPEAKTESPPRRRQRRRARWRRRRPRARTKRSPSSLRPRGRRARARSAPRLARRPRGRRAAAAWGFRRDSGRPVPLPCPAKARVAKVRRRMSSRST